MSWFIVKCPLCDWHSKGVMHDVCCDIRVHVAREHGKKLSEAQIHDQKLVTPTLFPERAADKLALAVEKFLCSTAAEKWEQLPTQLEKLEFAVKNYRRATS
jgi:hypothetical protein